MKYNAYLKLCGVSDDDSHRQAAGKFSPSHAKSLILRQTLSYLMFGIEGFFNCYLESKLLALKSPPAGVPCFVLYLMFGPNQNSSKFIFRNIQILQDLSRGI